MVKKKFTLIGLVLCLLCALLPNTAYAVSITETTELISVGKPCSLTLTYSEGTQAFSGAAVDVFRVASVDADCHYILTDDFSASGLTVNGLQSNAEWDAVRGALDAMVVSEKIAPTKTQMTNASGIVVFEDLEPGLYLVGDVALTSGGFRYYFDSTLVALPNLNTDGTWNYDVTAKPKSDKQNPTGEDIKYSVRKVWKDDGNQSRRPDEIVVELYKDGVAVNTVTLSDENDWFFSWYAEDDGSKWHVAEKNVPKGYVMTVEGTQTSFAIVNTYPTTSNDSPKTGDTSNIGFYTMLMLASGIGLLMVAMALKRKPK